MSKREKNLIFILFGVAFLIINAFFYASYKQAMQAKRIDYNEGSKELDQIEKELAAWASQAEDAEWLNNNQPATGTHGKTVSDLATYTEQSAGRSQVQLKVRPTPQQEDAYEGGAYRSARVIVEGNAMDDQLIQWLTDLYDPANSRAVTFLRISPQRTDDTRVDCRLDVTQWYSPEADEQDLPSGQ